MISMRRVVVLLLLSLLVHSTSAQQSLPFPNDLDGDGLTDTEEDLDADGVYDVGVETDPKNADTDRGGEADGAEVSAGRNPLKQIDDITFDADNDGLRNGEEQTLGTDPTNADTDGDGTLDGNDPAPLERSQRTDHDRDGLPGEWEVQHGLEPDNAKDATEDPDEDGLNNTEEFVQGTLPKEPDTDLDGVPDGTEVEQGTDPQENPCLSYGEPLPPFPDSANHWSKAFIARLQRTTSLPEGLPIIIGYPGDRGKAEFVFLPDRSISRFELLKIALLGNCIPLLGTQNDPPTKDFEDLSLQQSSTEDSDTSLRRRVVAAALEKGIVEGYPDGTFRANAPINRAEALKIFLLAARLPPPSDPTELPSLGFTDTASSSWFAPYAREALYYDLIEGYSDGTFRPGNPITRAEAAKLLLLTILENPRINGYVIPAEGL